MAVHGRDADRTAGAAAALAEQTGGHVAAAHGDLADAAGPATVVDRAVAALGGPVDILLCNAGGPPALPFADQDADAWQGAIALNLLSTVNLCRAAVPAMRAQGWGRVVCLTSVAAKQVVPGLMLSTAARAGVLGFAKALAEEVGPDGVTVNVVCPGYMHTDRLAALMRIRAERAGTTVDAVTADLVRGVPVGRIGEPDELAVAIAFLASEPARYITGAVLQVDGGAVRSIF